MRSSSAIRRTLVFTNYEKMETANKSLIRQLIAEILLRKNPASMDDAELQDTANIYAHEINEMIKNPIIHNSAQPDNAQPGRKRIVFINVENNVKIQTSVIDILKSMLNEEQKSWRDIREELIIKITGHPPKPFKQLVIKHHHSDKTTTLADIDAHTNLYIIYKLAYQNREASMGNATFKNYTKSIFLSFSGKAVDIAKNISYYGINESCVLHEVGHDFTKSPSFDWQALQVFDPVTLEPCDEPYMLDPGCMHALDKNSLKQWIETKEAKHQDPDCPCCRQGIDIIHIAILSMWNRPKPVECKQEFSEAQQSSSIVNSNNH
jgi:hypothetical protein